jgi:hypothetical protein
MSKIKDKNKNELVSSDYITSDFYIAVFLRASGYNVIGINKRDPRRFNFVFKNKVSMTKLLDNYFAGRAKVDPRNFTAAIKELKSLMYSDALQQ